MLRRLRNGVSKLIGPRLEGLSVESSCDVSCVELFAEHTFKVPTCFDIQGRANNWFMGYESIVAPASVYVAKNSRLILGQEELFAADYKFYRQLTTQIDNPAGSFTKSRFGKEVRIEGSVLALSLSGLENNYYHFLVEFMARWFLFKKSGLKVDYVVWPSGMPFHRQFRDLLGIRDENIVSWRNFDSLLADEVVYPSLINNYMHVMHSSGVINYRKRHLPSWLANVYKELKFGLGATNALTGNSPRLYLSRRSASSRRVLNEDALLVELKRRGFQVVEAEWLTVSEQMSIFDGANVVIAAHGAGLANISFSNPGLFLLELHPGQYQDSSHWLQALSLGHEYSYLLGESSVNSSRNPKDADFVIDIGLVLDWVDSLPSA